MKELRIAVASDLHLGHKRNLTDYIIKNLEAAFPDNAETAQLDLLVLAGDVFESLLFLPDDCVYEIDNWIAKMLRLCKKHDIVLRVLYGTPSHDRDQGRRFIHLNTAAGIGCDVKYITDLSIEYIERFDIRVLYVPDEWNHSAEKTLQETKELLASRGLEKVDYAFMHGAFDFQLPDIVPSKHNSDEYLKLVDKLIFIGHIHTFSQKDRITAQGSFDRLSHNEEEPKGHVRAWIRASDEYEIKFIENRNARKFITVDCRGLTLQETLDEIMAATVNLEDGSHVRVSCSKSNPILTEMDQLIVMRPLIHWSKHVKKDLADVESDDFGDEEGNVFVPISITRDNIVDLMMQRVSYRSHDPQVSAVAHSFLLEMR